MITVLTGTGMADKIQAGFALIIQAVTDFIPVLSEEPIVYYVAAGILLIGVGIVATFVPTRRRGRRR
jgi:Fe2+ transport system protein B